MRLYYYAYSSRSDVCIIRTRELTATKKAKKEEERKAYKLVTVVVRDLHIRPYSYDRDDR